MRKIGPAIARSITTANFNRVEGGYSTSSHFRALPAAVRRLWKSDEMGAGMRRVSDLRRAAHETRDRGRILRRASAFGQRVGFKTVAAADRRRPMGAAGQGKMRCWRTLKARPARAGPDQPIPPNACSARPRAPTSMTTGVVGIARATRAGQTSSWIGTRADCGGGAGVLPARHPLVPAPRVRESPDTVAIAAT